VTADPRVTAAREFLQHARTGPKPTALPRIVLDREDAELRRQLGQVLDAIDQAPTLTGPEHYRHAEQLLDWASGEDFDSPAERSRHAAAQVHATLALAAAGFPMIPAAEIDAEVAADIRRLDGGAK
jgi:Ser/Thr protein kinase RdoA (MazF antagonist)